MSEQHSPGTDPMVGEVRFKVPLPILIPVAALFAIAAVTIGMSRVLLSIPPEAATTVALASAANVLIAAAILAQRKRMGSTSLIEMGVIVVYPVVIGIVIALLGIGSGEAPTTEKPPPAQAGPVTAGGTLSAANIQFDNDAMELVAGEGSEITLANEDSTPHNVWIYETAQDADDLNDDATLFQGDDVGPGESTTYTIPALDKGEYPFLCRIHPAMRGLVTVK